jgi:hypothetical protein
MLAMSEAATSLPASYRGLVQLVGQPSQFLRGGGGGCPIGEECGDGGLEREHPRQQPKTALLAEPIDRVTEQDAGAVELADNGRGGSEVHCRVGRVAALGGSSPESD